MTANDTADHLVEPKPLRRQSAPISSRGWDYVPRIHSSYSVILTRMKDLSVMHKECMGKYPIISSSRSIQDALSNADLMHVNCSTCSRPVWWDDFDGHLLWFIADETPAFHVAFVDYLLSIVEGGTDVPGHYSGL